MRDLTNDEIEIVAGGDIVDPLSPETQDWYENACENMFDDFSFNPKGGKGVTIAKSESDAQRIMKEILDALPKGSATCTVKANGDNKGNLEWSVECSFQIIRK